MEETGSVYQLTPRLTQARVPLHVNTWTSTTCPVVLSSLFFPSWQQKWGSSLTWKRPPTCNSLPLPMDTLPAPLNSGSSWCLGYPREASELCVAPCLGARLIGRARWQDGRQAPRPFRACSSCARAGPAQAPPAPTLRRPQAGRPSWLLCPLRASHLHRSTASAHFPPMSPGLGRERAPVKNNTSPYVRREQRKSESF